MTEYTNITIDFISRTKDILNKLTDLTEYDVTLLLNCCLGLIGMPSEKYSGNANNHAIFSKKLMDVFNDPSWGITENSIKIPKSKKELANKKLTYLVKKIRNGICHFHIKAEAYADLTTKNKIIEKINIKDKHPKTNSLNFEIELSIEQLKTFAIKLADEILKSNT